MVVEMLMLAGRVAAAGTMVLSVLEQLTKALQAEVVQRLASVQTVVVVVLEELAPMATQVWVEALAELVLHRISLALAYLEAAVEAAETLVFLRVMA